MTTRDNEPQGNNSEPSFDELLGLSSKPSEPSTEPITAAKDDEPEQVTTSQDHNLEASATHSDDDNESDPFDELFGDALTPDVNTNENAPAQGFDFWSRPTAAEDEDLEPLILPGFSDEPIRSEPKPPVFQASPPAKPQVSEPFEEPAPTEQLTAVNSKSKSEPVESKSEPVESKSEPAVSQVTTPEPTRRPESPVAEDAFAAALLASGATQTTDQEPYEKISVTGGEKRSRRFVPWAVVGATATVAIVAAVFAVNVFVGGGSETQPAPAPTPTPTPTPAPKPTPDTSEEKEQEAEAEANNSANKPPTVDVGEVWKVDITQWNISVDVSQRLGGMNYVLETNSKAMLSLPLAEGLPESCASARTGWGLQRQGETNKFTAIRPEPRCTNPADAAVYDTIWGLVDAMAKSARPMG